VNKKSFIIYNDSKEVFDRLSDKDAGKLIKGIFQYQQDGTYNLTNLLEIIFIPIKQSLDRNKEKYDSICKRNKTNGIKGGRPKEPTGLFGKTNKPKEPDSDSDSDNDSDSESDKQKRNNKPEVFDYNWLAEEEIK